MTEFVSSPANLLSILSFVISCSRGVLLCLLLRRFTHERYVVVASIWKLPPWISSPLHSSTLFSPMIVWTVNEILRTRLNTWKQCTAQFVCRGTIMPLTVTLYPSNIDNLTDCWVVKAMNLSNSQHKYVWNLIKIKTQIKLRLEF